MRPWFIIYVRVHIERVHLVDLSFQDTAILMKNGEKKKQRKMRFL